MPAYSDLTQALVILAEQNDALATYTSVQSPDFTAYLPNIILLAEQRCYREVCPLAAEAQLANANVTGGSRTLSLAAFTPQMIVPEGITIITPVSTIPAAGDRWSYRKATIDFIDFTWPFEATALSPSAAWPECYWAMKDAQTIVFAPTPDQSYAVEATGTIRPTPLSAGNPTTYLSNFYWDVFVKACMIETTGFLRDYGAESDDPKLAVTWREMYETAKASAVEEEMRRRGVAPGSGPLPESAAEPTQRKMGR